MTAVDPFAAIRDAALAKLAKAQPDALACMLGPGDGCGSQAPDALVVASGGAPPALWLDHGWRPAYVECADAGAASFEALNDAGYECFRTGASLFALRRDDFHPGDIAVYRLLRDQTFAVLALSNMLAGAKI